MATGGAPFDDSADELHNWSVTNASLEDRLNNMDWSGAQQKKANRSSDKNKKKLSAALVAEGRLTNDISPSSTPWSGRRRPAHMKYTSQLSVPDQAELDKIQQRIHFSDLDESIGSDSQGRVTAANNQRQLAAENKKPYNFVPLHINTNKNKELLLLPPATSTPSTPVAIKETKKQSAAVRDAFTPGAPTKEAAARPIRGSAERGAGAAANPDYEEGQDSVVSSLLVSKLVQIREYIGKASSMRDDLVEKNDVPANVERLSHLIEHLKEQEKSYLRFLQKMLARKNEEDDGRTQDSAMGSGSLVESTSLNVDVRPPDASNAPGDWPNASMRDQNEELENFRKQHLLLKKMLEQQDQLRALQGRQEALLAMQQSAEQALAVIEDAAVVTETTGSVSGLSITSELNDELNDLIQRFHNQLRDSRTKSVPDNRRQAESLSLSREVSWSRAPGALGPPQHRPVLHSASGPHGGLDGGGTTAASAKLTKLQELQDKKETMDKILDELHSLRDQTLNNNYCGALSTQRSLSTGGSSDCPSASCSTGAAAAASFHPLLPQHADTDNSNDKLRKLKEVHKRLNELRELVQYFQQTSDMMVDAVNENVKEDEEEEDDEGEEDEEEVTEDSSMLEAMFDYEQENRQPPTNIRNPQRSANWGDSNSLANRCSVSSSATTNANNRDSRLNSEINNRSAVNLRSFHIPSAIECQYNRDTAYNWAKDEDGLNNDGGGAGAQPGCPDDEASGSGSGSSLASEAGFSQELRQQKAEQKLRRLQELVAMVQSDDTDTTANEDETLHQQQNNTRVTMGGPPPAAGPQQDPRGSDAALYRKAREKIYKEKLRQQKQALEQLHEERQMLGEIQGKIQDLQLTCPDLQSSLSSQASEQGLIWKVPAAASTPAVAQPSSSSSAAKGSPTVLNPTTPEAAATSVPDNEQLWSEMRRHQVAREELRQRRKHLESLMAEHQRRRGLAGSLCGADEQAAPSQLAASRDERTMATWGSTPCNLDEEEDGDYRSERSAEEEDRSESSSADDGSIFPTSMTQPLYKKNNQECSPKPPPAFSSVHESPHVKPKTKQPQPPPPRSWNPSASQPANGRRQENLCWASEVSVAEGSTHWQEQISQLQRQLDFSTNMCQTLLQDQQMLSYMLQSVMAGSYGALPNNLTSPQVHLVMHQLNQCYTQLAWQQTNVQRLKQVLNELLQQQQQEPQQQKQQHPHQPSPSAAGFSLFPLFPAAMSHFPPGAASAHHESPEQQKRHSDPNTSIKTESMTFPPPLQRSPLNVMADRRPAGRSNNSFPNNSSVHHPPPTGERRPSFSPPSFTPPQRRHSPRNECERASEASFSSLPDRADPTTVTKTFKTGRKASAQANLASRSKSRRKRGKGHNKNNEGLESDSLSSTADFDQERAASSRHHDQHLLDKLTQEKLDSKSKLGNRQDDISSAYAWRTPFLSNRIACTEAADASSDFSLFEALRETIYSEVATLISQNESRPHFLIELFHELQLLNTDYLRQRALYSLQDLVSRHLAEKSASQEMPPLGAASWAGGSQSELTPSESSTASDVELVGKNLKKRDDIESVGNDSTLSSTTLDPFSKDDLGNTVIHLDKALARMRQYERMKHKVDASTAADSDLRDVEAAAAAASAVAPPEAADGAFGDVHSPQIDTSQLNRQIKEIMSEVIPFLKEKMHEACTPQLLTSLRRQVLALTRQNDDSKEFVRFFHRQLGAILQDSLSRFIGQTLKDCGEDLLVEVSDILFNELAFFRLMQDLDHGIAASPEAGHIAEKAERPPDADQTLKGSAALEVNASASPDEDTDRDETKQKVPSLLPTDTKSYDEDEDGEEADGQAMPPSIRLSKAESQALNNYGSGEDENDDDDGREPDEFEAAPVDVLTSLQVTAEGPAEPQAQSAEETKESDLEPANGDGVESGKLPVPASTEDEPAETASYHSDKEEDPDGVIAAAASEENIKSAEVHAALKDSNTTSTPDTESPVMISVDMTARREPINCSVIGLQEAVSGNSSQRTSDEDDFVRVDDLPLQLPVTSQEALQKRIVDEQQTNDLRVEILSGNAETPPGLVGNGGHLKEPESSE
ncbi:pericentriolar material 1 protein isoform X3 [Hippocampus comes]|uniref:pericentriolar material 1 protein isoform X3 n=1 Tax=Hippocampus comes TaxID=109280 RepID=UPI00094E0C12|nr:PREDICTED: pericentriolar material 1 protein isoform X3 [Hippocampus comes]